MGTMNIKLLPKSCVDWYKPIPKRKHMIPNPIMLETSKMVLYFLSLSVV